jgi:hypothetical protein
VSDHREKDKLKNKTEKIKSWVQSPLSEISSFRDSIMEVAVNIRGVESGDIFDIGRMRGL